jgi:Helix-turn-helix domain
MAVEWMEWVLKNVRIQGNKRWVLMSLANHADENGQNSWPSVGTMAEDANCSERTVQYALRSLEKDGYITPEGKSAYGTTMYRLSKEGGAESAPPLFEGATGEPPGVQPGDEEGATITAPKPSKEPSVNRHMRVVEDEEGPGSAPLLPEVMRILDETAFTRSWRRARPDGILEAMLEFPEKDPVVAARELRAWLLYSEKGQRIQRADLTRRYRHFLKTGEDKKQSATGGASVDDYGELMRRAYG